MKRLNQFRYMWSSARALQLSLPDTGRWLWSYYASRLPGARVSDTRCVQVAVRDRAGRKHPLLIRRNGYDWAVMQEIFVDQVYRVDLTNVKHILDLGGNIGLAALSFAWNFPDAQICTVEPMPENLAILRRNVELNRAPVQIVAAAVGTENGQARFSVSEDPRRHSASVAVPTTDRLVDVNVLSVPSLMKLMDWEDIDLLKIDIEGGEKDLLSGQPSWLKNVRCIIGEGHAGVGYTIEVCRENLEPLGFQIQEIDRNEGAMVSSRAGRDKIHRPLNVQLLTGLSSFSKDNSVLGVIRSSHRGVSP